MKGEISKDYYCSAGYESTDLEDGDMCPMQLHLEPEDRDCKNCGCYHRKHPTPEQFKEEYGEDVSDDMPVWILCGEEDDIFWQIFQYGDLRDLIAAIRKNVAQKGIIVIACTPFGKPDNDWRPE